MFSEALGIFDSLEIREVIIPFSSPFENRKRLFFKLIENFAL